MLSPTYSIFAVLGRCVPELLLNLGRTIERIQAPNSTLNNLISQLGDGGGKVPSESQLANTSDVMNTLVDGKTILEKVFADIRVTYWQILVILALTALCSLVWTLAIRIVGALFIWSTIVLLLSTLASGSLFCWYKYKVLSDLGAVNDFSFQPNLQFYFEMPHTWLVIAIGVTTLFTIIFIVLLLVRTRIKLAIALIDESSRAVSSMFSSLFFPVFPFFAQILVFIVWAMTSVWLATSGSENCRKMITVQSNLTEGPPCDCSMLNSMTGSQCHFVNLTTDDRIVYLQGYNLFAFFWVSCFVSALADMSLAGAFASYYWAAKKPQDIPSFPLARAFGRAVRYHLGTLAFGSLIVAIVKFARTLLEYLERKSSVVENRILKLIFKCMKCLFWCLETFLRFLSKNAFIMTAIYGKNFCTSARDSFSLIANNAVRFVVLDKVTDFLLFLGKAIISIGSGVVAFMWFSGRWRIDGVPHFDLHYYFVPISIVVVGAYYIADCFFDVYEMAVKTTFLCFLKDTEINDGTPARPFLMSKELRRIFEKSSKLRNNDE